MPYLCVQTYKREISIQFALRCDCKCRSHLLRFTTEDVWAIMLHVCALEPQVHCCNYIGVSKMCFKMWCSSFSLCILRQKTLISTVQLQQDIRGNFLKFYILQNAWSSGDRRTNGLFCCDSVGMPVFASDFRELSRGSTAGHCCKTNKRSISNLKWLDSLFSVALDLHALMSINQLARRWHHDTPWLTAPWFA